MPNDQSLHISKNPFAVFAENPEGVCFENQEKNETIVLLLRQHLITQVGAIFEIAVLSALPVLIGPLLSIININLFSTNISAVQSFWLVVCWYLFVFGFSLYKFIFWYFNVYLITNERIIDFDFKGILHKETSYANLSQVQDVSPKMIGFFATFFHFGDVYVQTASEKPEFEFHRVERPDDVAKVLFAQVRHEEAEEPGEIS